MVPLVVFYSSLTINDFSFSIGFDHQRHDQSAFTNPPHQTLPLLMLADYT